MSLSGDFTFLHPAAITIDRDKRQRKLIDTKGLKESISQRGILNPLIITRENELIAGERRLTAALELGLHTIPVRFADDLDPIELQIIELEENLKRSDLSWREQVQAIATIHQLYLSNESSWTQSATSEAIGLDKATVSQMLRVARDLNHAAISAATSYAAAYNVLARLDSRKADNVLSDLLEQTDVFTFGAGGTAENAPTLAPHAPADGAGIGTPAAIPAPVHGQKSGADSGVAPAPAPHTIRRVADAIQCADFLTWLQSYSGPKFNFVHCDFPYGVNVFGGSQGAAGSASVAGNITDVQEQLYDDSPEVYWELLEAFCKNLDTFMAHNAHLMFWFSIKHIERTLETFRRLAPSIEFNPYPLIWVKSDNRGILPDPKRGPRQIYETALIGSRNDKLIIKPTSNAYVAPSDKTYHMSTKPEPMLRYFFQMFVDDTTSILDPTCGSGSAIRAAESLGAKHALGLERDENHAKVALEALRKFRVLKSLG